MKLLNTQKNTIRQLIENAGYDFSKFKIIIEKPISITYDQFVIKLIGSCSVFLIRESIQGALFCDVFLLPALSRPHFYLSCDSFEECCEKLNEWLTSIKDEYQARDSWIDCDNVVHAVEGVEFDYQSNQILDIKK